MASGQEVLSLLTFWNFSCNAFFMESDVYNGKMEIWKDGKKAGRQERPRKFMEIALLPSCLFCPLTVLPLCPLAISPTFSQNKGFLTCVLALQFKVIEYAFRSNHIMPIGYACPCIGLV